MNEVTLNVCQGLGDIFWVYQKFAPHFDRIHFNVLQVGGDKRIENRALPFLQLLPKIGSIGALLMTGAEYDAVVRSNYPMKDIIDISYSLTGKTNNLKARISFDYSCNNALERGIRLEAIDPGIALEETVPLQPVYAPLAFDPGHYACIYISGSTNDSHPRALGAWDPGKWVYFIERCSFRLPIIMIGASFDSAVMNEIAGVLKTKGFEVATYVESWAANVFYILKNAVFFIGFQSGLNVLADNLDVKQLMLYYPILGKMMHSWPKQRNIDNKIYNAALFSDSVDQIIAKIVQPSLLQ